MHYIKHKRAIQNRIFKWFDRKQRDLPWLKQASPYHIWVSEIMLQQTQIATVLGYYHRFIDRFPDVKQLAMASIDDVLKLWEGLGYYRRAKQLHQAAQVIVENHNGSFPTQFEDVLALPGIGRYTAAAILSIALEQKHPILEGNTIRLFARLLASRADTSKSATQRTLWQFSEALISDTRPGDFNQALMDLGREICKPKNPLCDSCPVVDYCPTYIQGLQQLIPVKGNKMQYEDLHEAIVLIERKGKYLLRKCRPGERWAGLWDFPRTDCQKDDDGQVIGKKLSRITGLELELQSLNKTIKHAVTKYRIRLDCFVATGVKGRLIPGTFAWQSAQVINELPLSSSGRKFADAFIQ